MSAGQPQPGNHSIREQLYDYISDLRIVSSHTHILSDQQLAQTDLDFILSNSYLAWVCPPPEKTHAARQEYILAHQCNSYFRWLFKSLHKIYGVEVTADSFEELDARIKKAKEDSAFHINILKNSCGFERAILDKADIPGYDNGHPDVFSPAYRINMFMDGYSSTASDYNGVKAYDHIDIGSISTFDEYLEAMKAEIRNKKQQGIVAIKNATAYERSQIYDNTDKHKAAKAFFNPGASAEDIRNFGDYIMFTIAGLAEELGLPIQMHAGLGNIDNTRAIGMRKLIESYPNVKFDIFHAGYPWTSDVLALLHNLKNTYVDLCWLPLLSTTEAKDFLIKALEVASAHRICWGCDTLTSEESFGAVLAMRAVFSDALTDMILDGALDLEYAKYIAHRILVDNPKELYKL